MYRMARCWVTLLAFHLGLLIPGTAAALTGADVAVYNDATAPSGYTGAWQNGVTAVKNMLSSLGYTYEEITYTDLNTSTQDFTQLYKIILVPGGYAQWYNYWISKAGKQRIRDFVAAGGGYFGICAGAFFAADRASWEGTLYDDGAGTNAYGELTGYDLDLFPGIGTGPLNGIADWNTTGHAMTTVRFDSATTALQAYKPPPFTEEILYYGGPYFTPDAGAAVDVLATYDYNGEAAIVGFAYGSGRVVLTGPHPEIEEDGSSDGVTIDREAAMDDSGSDWPLTNHLLLWILKKPASPTYALWTRSDTGRAALWKVDPTTQARVGSAWLGSEPGIGSPWQATSYEHVSSTEGYVLWTRNDTGKAALWKINPGTGATTSSAYLHSKSGNGAPWQATGYKHVSATEGYVLWARDDLGKAALWKIDPSGLGTREVLEIKQSAYVHTAAGVGSSWQATSYERVSATEGRVLWTQSLLGKAALWKIDISGLGTLPVLPMVQSAYLHSAAGVGSPWKATSYDQVSATEGRVLWTRSDLGKAAVWKIDPSGLGALAILPIQQSAYLLPSAGVGSPWQATGVEIVK